MMDIYSLELDKFDEYCITIPNHTEDEMSYLITEEVEREEQSRTLYEYMQWRIYAEPEEEFSDE